MGEPTFDEIVAKVLARDDFRAQIAELGLDPDELAGDVRAKRDEIEASVAAEAEGLRLAQEKVVDAQRLVRSRLRRQVAVASALEISAVSLGLPAALLLVTYLGLRFVVHRGPGWRIAGVVAVGVVGVLALLSVVAASVERRLARVRARLRTESNESALEQGLADAQKAFLDALEFKAVVPAVTSAINEARGQTYSSRLVIRRTLGLSEVFDPAYEIPTQARADLLAIMESVTGASIGIAGHRGTGKSTLIRSFCEGSAARRAGWEPIGLSVGVPVEYDARDLLLHLFAELCRKVTTRVGGGTTDATDPSPRGAFEGGALSRVARRLRLREQDARHPPPIPDDPVERLRISAANHLHAIRFQQSFTSGWSGGLKSPIAEIGLNNETSWSLRGMTYPEIIFNLRSFLAEASATFRPIVIGIDELDKIETEQSARRFVNEIKGMFGVDHCYFLVSVSREAMSAFERRGMPFRDEFDSAFDEFIEIRYLDFEATSTLLKRRIIGPSVQFVGLIFALSSGLPRDAIRAARALVAESKDSGSDNLSDLTKRLVKKQFLGQIDGVSIQLGHAGAVERLREDVTALRADYAGRDLFVAGQDLLRRVAEEPFAEDETTRLVRMQAAQDLAAFSYYARTLVEIFDGSLDKNRTIAAQGDGGFDVLGRARQSLAWGAPAAWAAITLARAKWGLREEEPPSPPGPGPTLREGRPPAKRR